MDILSDHITEAELAAQLKRKPSTLERWRRLRLGPPFVRVGKQPLYRITSVTEWLQSQEVRPPRAVRHTNQRNK